MRGPVGVAYAVARRALILVVACGTIGIAAGCTRQTTTPHVPNSAASGYVLMTLFSKLPQLEYRANVGAAVVEADVASSSVEPTALKRVDGSGSSSWGPAHATRSGRRWMIVRACGTNKSWGYPPVDLGRQMPTLTLRGKTVLPDSSDGGSTSAVYQKLSPGGLPPVRVSNIQNARVAFGGVFEVPSTPGTYTLTWDLGRSGTARFDFRF